MGAPAPRPAGVPGAALGLLAAGAALRLLHYLGRPGLALDEARLSLNIASRGFTALSTPLAHDQSAPLLFLWAEHAMTRLFGVNELALRALSLLAGVAVLGVSWLVVRRLLRPRAALLGLAILAASPAMVAYSNEVKQYMPETFVAAALLLLALEWLDGTGRRATAWLGVAGVVSVWLSGSAVLVLAATVPALWLDRPGSPRRSAAVFGMAAAWAASFAGAYLLVYRTASANPYMNRFWAPAFLDIGTGFLGRVRSAAEELVWGFVVGHSGWPRQPEADPYVRACTVLGLACVLLGLVRLWRARRPVAALLAGPLVVVCMASALGRYPMAQRLTLFAVPLLVILGVAGLDALVDRLRKPWGNVAWWTVSGLVVIPLLGVTVLQATALEAGSLMPRLVHDLSARRRDDEPVYVFGRALPAWEFYTTDWSNPDRPRLAFLDSIARSTGPAFENSPSRGRPVGIEEGRDLRYRSARGDELIGLPTGMEYRAGTGLFRKLPDPGWVAREADRVQGAAAPAAWVLMAEYFGPEYELVEELRRRGGRVTDSVVVPGHVLVRYEFSAGPTRTM